MLHAPRHSTSTVEGQIRRTYECQKACGYQRAYEYLRFIGLYPQQVVLGALLSTLSLFSPLAALHSLSNRNWLDLILLTGRR